MKATPFLAIIAAGLLVSNVALTALLLNDKPKKHHSPKELVTKRLHLDPQQEQAYEHLIHQHRAAVHEVEMDLEGLRRQLYAHLSSQKPVPDSLYLQLGAAHQSIEKANYEHFAAIKLVIKPEQQEAFEAFVNELVVLFNHPKPPRREER